VCRHAGSLSSHLVLLLSLLQLSISISSSLDRQRDRDNRQNWDSGLGLGSRTWDFEPKDCACSLSGSVHHQTRRDIESCNFPAVYPNSSFSVICPSTHPVLQPIRPPSQLHFTQFSPSAIDSSNQQFGQPSSDPGTNYLIKKKNRKTVGKDIEKATEKASSEGNSGISTLLVLSAIE
jgi:hypothetical protein